jgi:hypothetical protein
LYWKNNTGLLLRPHTRRYPDPSKGTYFFSVVRHFHITSILTVAWSDGTEAFLFLVHPHPPPGCRSFFKALPTVSRETAGTTFNSISLFAISSNVHRL